MHAVLAFYVICNFDGKTKESDGGKCPPCPLAKPMIKDPGA